LAAHWRNLQQLAQQGFLNGRRGIALTINPTESKTEFTPQRLAGNSCLEIKPILPFGVERRLPFDRPFQLSDWNT